MDTEMNSKMRFYKRHDVFERHSEHELIVYRCLEVLPAGGFVVQSADRVRVPEGVSSVEQHERQFLELMCEVAPEDRSEPHASITEAIEAFKADFGM
ncbi:hypothetical protein JYK02_37200 [Corallococcus macrosporus]|uniref:Uncharacterized protein n=1 Tax=Corallococcus macrosporus TaxID=35 RepID=A0ABS3DPA4_9BACT|nr:hypothetical protein [Corallococcus macrosporus]MBN8233166.1 hypothetical protein [Corallococcus macrosporus]